MKRSFFLFQVSSKYGEISSLEKVYYFRYGGSETDGVSEADQTLRRFL